LSLATLVHFGAVTAPRLRAPALAVGSVLALAVNLLLVASGLGLLL
jgi:hypothetical protein